MACAAPSRRQSPWGIDDPTTTRRRCAGTAGCQQRSRGVGSSASSGACTRCVICVVPRGAWNRQGRKTRVSPAGRLLQPTIQSVMAMRHPPPHHRCCCTVRRPSPPTRGAGAPTVPPRATIPAALLRGCIDQRREQMPRVEHLIDSGHIVTCGHAPGGRFQQFSRGLNRRLLPKIHRPSNQRSPNSRPESKDPSTPEKLSSGERRSGATHSHPV